MKNRILVIFLIVGVHFYGQNKYINYQAVIRDLDNSALANQNIGVRISVSADTLFTNSSFVEVHNTKTNVNGLFNISIGAGIPIKKSFDSIKWSQSNQFVKTEIDINGGSNYKHFSTTEMKSVPYALHSRTADYCKIAENTVVNPQRKRYIGEYYGGGVIFHLEYDSLGNEHGLIAATKIIVPVDSWSNVNILIGNPSKFYNGFANSIMIVAQNGHTNSCAKQCLDYVNGGFDDWYLPSIDELRLLVANKYSLNKVLEKIPGSILMTGGSYWSSTESLFDSAYFYNLELNTIGFSQKNKRLTVRPIRKF
jgi:hypothetical protein